MRAGTKVYSVTQINTYIRDLLRRDVIARALTIRGEVSNCTYHGSGHIYFTLKDKTSTLSCVMFASDRAGLSFQMREGQQVQVRGRLDVYPQGGRYQLYAQEITLDGAGQLYEAYLKLKDRLEEEGLFAEEYKRPLPPYVKTLGVVTAPTGAAVRDIIRNALRRNPYLQIILYPALVQGEGAAASVAKGIRTLSKKGVDVMIVGRGGGSIEDLWAFNEEEVARAIFDAPVPVVSAVGHETDVTIADFVADLRAPTPSTAAELCVFEYDRFAEDVRAVRLALTEAMTERLDALREDLETKKKSLKYISPEAKVRDLKLRADRYREQLHFSMTSRISVANSRLLVRAERLKGLSPQARLEAGYAYVTDAHGMRLRGIRDVVKGDMLRVYLHDGQMKTLVEETVPEEGAHHGGKENGKK